VHLSVRRNSLHPWIYKRMVRRPRARIVPGALVEVRSREDEFVARAIYSPASEVALRVLTEDPDEEVDAAFFAERLRRARDLREKVLRLQERTDAYRLVHAEADGLSGLVVDKYGEVAVLRLYSAGYLRLLDQLTDALNRLYPGMRVAVRADAATARREGFDLSSLPSARDVPGRVVVHEDGRAMEVDLAAGHKTGFFLDQRDNRSCFAGLVAGARVLDCFCYTGGFAIAAARGGASAVRGVDLDERALACARANARRNAVDVEFEHADVFDVLRRMSGSGESYDAVVLDPAKLAGVRAEVRRARRTYGDLNRLACGVVREGGLLLTCSCSGLVSAQDFVSIVGRSAAQAGCHLQVFRIAGAAADHPVISSFPEGRYLKAVFARVMRRGFPQRAPAQETPRRDSATRPDRRSP
jgi:23S rRNA (cytosine1962-C5)-methyltransferase